MKLLLVNEYYHIVSQNLIHYLSELLPNDFHWTGKDKYRVDFLPFTKEEEKTYLPEPFALSNLEEGYYTHVIFGEGTKCLYLTPHLKEKGVKRIIIDSTDTSFLIRKYRQNADYYFKCQLPKKDILIRNTKDNSYCKASDEELENVFPLSLTPSFKEANFNHDRIKPIRYNYDVFFNGSAWPEHRLKIISQIKEAKEISFFGGLFNRDDLKFNCVVPDELFHRKMNPSDYQYALNSSRIGLNIRGNGENCYRQYEILSLGSFLLTQKTKTCWGHKEPQHDQHALFFDTDTNDIIDIIKSSLADNQKMSTIRERGSKFYRDNLHPRCLAEYILDTIIS